MRLLIAENDKSLATFLGRELEAEGHRVHIVHDGGQALSAFKSELPDLTILALNMPVIDGEQVLEHLRMLNEELPVMVLTGRHDVDARVRCLDLGADDLMQKPFSVAEMRARCRALLRRKTGARVTLRAADLELDRLQHAVVRGGQPVELTKKEFALLEHLLLHRGRCVSRLELLNAVWKLDGTQTTNVVDVYVNYLRRKLHDLWPGTLIRTVRGEGYRIPFEIEFGTSGSSAGDLQALRHGSAVPTMR